MKLDDPVTRHLKKLKNPFRDASLPPRFRLLIFFYIVRRIREHSEIYPRFCGHAVFVDEELRM